VREAFRQALARLPEGLREESLTHVSYANERGVPSNERLEFLGDAVFHLASAHLLYLSLPDSPEGDLTRLRASLVSGSSLAAIAAACGLGELVKLGRGEEASGGRSRTRLLAGALEAVMGAVFLSAGWDEARRLACELLGASAALGEGARVPVDPKTLVQELVQKSPGQTVEYKVVNVEGPDHAPVYTVVCLISGEEVSVGRGGSKKDAEEDAAANYLRRRESTYEHA